MFVKVVPVPPPAGQRCGAGQGGRHFLRLQEQVPEQDLQVHGQNKTGDQSRLCSSFKRTVSRIEGG